MDKIKAWLKGMGVAIVCLMVVMGLKTKAISQANENALSDYLPADVSDTPINITFDFAKEKGEFSKELFTCMDSPFVERETNELIKELNFKVVADMEKDLNPGKARAIADYGFDALIFVSPMNYDTKEVLEAKTQDTVNRISALKKENPGFDVKYFIFGNEPDMPCKQGMPDQGCFWKGTRDEFFDNYSVFARSLKRLLPESAVGGLGVSSATSAEGREWLKEFIAYVHGNKVPLDFLPYHCYSPSIKAYIDGFNFVEGLLKQYPGLSPLYGEPKIAVTELDVAATPVTARYEYPEDWKAAHNILAMLYLVDRGVWMAIDYGGPSRESANGASFLWLKADGAKKPVYFAHQAFNNLAGTVQIAQEGSSFETFGAAAGKSKDNNSMVVVLASYEQYTSRIPENERQSQSQDAKVYKNYTLKMINLPFTDKDTLVLERYLVDGAHNLTLAESEEIKGAAEISIARDAGLPQVQLLKIRKK